MNGIRTIQFFKYQGTGNDFILIDRTKDPSIQLRTEEIRQLCDRRFGVGGDGLMFLDLVPGYDFQMVYFNSDGRESTMCGNGGRCIVQFAADLGLVKDHCLFMAVDGPHHAKILERQVALEMMDVPQIQAFGGDFVLNTGSPHYVKIFENTPDEDIVSFGKSIRYSADFERDGINVNQCQITGESQCQVQTYERGVEDETYSCGTGVVASVLAAHHAGHLHDSEVAVDTKGGRLRVSFVPTAGGGYQQIWLHGPAKHVFHGEISI